MPIESQGMVFTTHPSLIQCAIGSRSSSGPSGSAGVIDIRLGQHGGERDRPRDGVPVRGQSALRPAKPFLADRAAQPNHD